MTTETESQTAENQQDKADAEAAFSAGFEGKDIPPATKPAGTTEPEKNADEGDAAATVSSATEAAAVADKGGAQATATQPQDPAAADPEKSVATEAAPTTAPSPRPDETAELRAALRRLEGRYGALHDQLTQLKTSKEAEGKPAVATQVELARLKAEYPELADVLTEDLAKVIGGLAPGKAADPKELDDMVSQRVRDGVAKEAAQLRDAAVTDAHPTWKADLFTVDSATGQKKPTADYLAWRKTLREDEAQAFEQSTNPYQVIRNLNGFYEWKNKAAKEAEAKQQRLKQAVTPQGVPRASPPTMSDDEAMRKGFEEGFNS